MSGAPAMASWDVRLMDFAARLLLAGVALACVAAAAWWALRQPVFAIGRITVDGDVEHNSASSLQANIVPLLQGNFITLQMAQAQAAFESAPWVRRAVVRREFPNLLHVTLQEHVPVAYWEKRASSCSMPKAKSLTGRMETTTAAPILTVWRRKAKRLHPDLCLPCPGWMGRRIRRPKCWPCISGWRPCSRLLACACRS